MAPHAPGLRAGLLLALSPPAAMAVGPSEPAWFSVSQTNCYTNDQEGDKGGELISPDTDPIPGKHLMLTGCMEACKNNVDCTGFMLQDTQYGWKDTCFLRKNIHFNECSKAWNDFNLWIKPAVASDPLNGLQGGLESLPNQWLSYPSTNCHPGGGAQWADGKDHEDGHFTMKQCEDKCIATPACEGMIWRDTMDAYSSNCFLRKDIVLSDCATDEAWDLRKLVRGHLRPGGATTTMQEAGSMPETSTTSTEETTTTDTLTGGMTTSTLAPSPSGPWPTVAATNCYTGKGGDKISEAGYDPYPGHLLLKDCQALCDSNAECEAVLMHDTRDDHDDNCWLRKDIDIASCEQVSTWNVWIKPGKISDGANSWVSYAATNCFPGMGAEYAVEGQDVLPGHQQLEECEKICDQTNDCEAIVWHDTEDIASSNCYLRKNVVVSHCHSNTAFNLRMKSSFIQTFSVFNDRGADADPVLAASSGAGGVFGMALVLVAASMVGLAIYSARQRLTSQEHGGGDHVRTMIVAPTEQAVTTQDEEGLVGYE